MNLAIIGATGNVGRKIIEVLEKSNLKKEEIIFVDSLEIANHKTKKLFNSLKKFNFNSALFIHSDKSNNENFKKASSNIPKLAMLSEKGLNVRDLMTFDKIFIEKTAIELITKRLT